MAQSDLDNVAVENFRAYLQIPTVQPNVNYDSCVEFLRKQGEELNLGVSVVTLVKDKPIVVLTWPGTQPELPSILLNSHMDVVPVYPELWTRDPFGAEVDEEGNIYARGSQDMKCVGIQYIETVRRLQSENKTLKRTLHISFVPDEEIGGHDGMMKWVLTDEFRALNVGFAYDEGLASENNTYFVYYSERAIWHVDFKITGAEGHGSLLLANTVGEKVRKLLDFVDDFRQKAVDKLASDPSLSIGDVTSANLTILKGGVEPNVIPPEVAIVVDFRLSVDVDHEAFGKQLDEWCELSGGGITYTFHQKNDPVPPTILDDSNPYWVAANQAFTKLGASIQKAVFPAATDSRYCRGVGIPVVGFSPMNNTPVLLHANDEYLNREVFLRGIQIYQEIIPAVANLS